MHPPDPRTRRTVLTSVGAALVTLAGCTGTERIGTRSDTSRTPPTVTGESPLDDRPTSTPRNPRSIDVSGAWPQRGGGSAHTGVTDAPGVPAAGEPYWHLRRIRSGAPVLAHGKLFHYAKLGDDPHGTPTLTRTRESPAGTAHPVYGEPYLLCRTATTGTIEWAAPLRGPGAGWPAVSDGVVVVGVNGQLAAFDTGGSRLWDHDLGNRTINPTLAEGRAVVSTSVHGPGADTGDVRAYRLSTGEQTWSHDIGVDAAGVALTDERVFVPTADGTIQSLAVSTGEPQWTTKVGDDRLSGIVAAGDAIYVQTNDEGIALDADTGTVRWRTDQWSGVAADAGTVYRSEGADLSAVTASDGRVRWRVEVERPGDRYFVTPAVGDGTVFAGTTGVDADLRALDAADGTERWRYQFPTTVVEGDMMRSGLEAQPAIADGAVYVYAADGLYGFAAG